MNAWGVILIALAAGVLYWSDRHSGSLGELGADIGLGTLLATGVAGKIAPTGSAGNGADEGAGTGAEDPVVPEVP